MAGSPTRALIRGLAVIEVLAEHHAGMRLTDIAERADLDKATTIRLLSTLDSAGYVTRDPDGVEYRLTAKILGLAEGVAAQLDLRYLARPHLRRLSTEVDEIVHLGVLQGEQVVYIEKIEPPVQHFRLVTAVGQTMPVHSTALGKAIMSRLPAAEVSRLMDRLELLSFTPNTVSSIPELTAAVARCKERGWALDDEENLAGAMCVAAPVLGSDGYPLAAVSISSLRFRVEDRVDELGERVRDAAARISLEVGGS